MTKTKKAPKGAVAQDNAALRKAKDAGVVKAAQTPKAKSKEIAKQITAKQDVKTNGEKKAKHKKVKQPTPEPESESESESEVSAGSDSDSESESESKVKAPTKNGTLKGYPAKSTADDPVSESSDDEPAAKDLLTIKAGVTKGRTKPSSDEDEEDDESEDSDESDVAAPAASNGTHKQAEVSSEESESSDSDDNEDEASHLRKPGKDDNLEKKLAPAASKKTSGGDPDDSEAAEEDDDSSDGSSDSSDNSSKEEVEPPRAASKRKAEEEADAFSKKARTVSDASSAQGKNLFVGGLSWNVDEDMLTREFEEFGELTGVRVISDRATGRSKGFGYIEFANGNDAASAHAAKQGAEIDGRRINLDFATARTGGDQRDRGQARAKTYGDQTGEPTDTLWVGNISFQVDQNQLSDAFQGYGTVMGVRLPTDRETGALKGFGYVTFSSVDEAQAALGAMQGYDLAGRSLRLDFSQPRQNNGEGGRGGGRGGFGDRGRGGFGGRGGGRGGFGDRGGRGGGRGGARGGRGGTTNRGGFGDFSGKKTTF